MSQIQGIPNMLSQLGFSFNIKKAPLTSAMTYQVNAPDISTGFAIMPTPFMDQAFAPDKLEYGNINISFKVDENLQNYAEMLNWIKGITFPNGFNQYATASRAQDGDGIYSDGSLILLTNSGNPGIEYKIKDMFPIALSGLRVNSQEDSVDYISADVTFKIRDFEIVTL